MNVFKSTQPYRSRNQTSHAIPRPHAVPLIATAVRAYESTLKMESAVIANIVVVKLNVAFRSLNMQLATKTYAARPTSFISNNDLAKS